jgi:meso-butanediol dehydrogenase / (S,S)-butanediol dehydrogenase / diacetyl reductase
VNAICPGIIRTDMWDYNDRVWGACWATTHRAPDGRMGAEHPHEARRQGKDVAGFIAFLASEDAAYITGQTINVDGGLIMS